MEFPGGLVIRTQHLQCCGPRLNPWSLVAELRFHKPRGAGGQGQRGHERGGESC